MSDYKTMYYLLFNAVTDASKILLLAQREAEELFVNQDAGDDADNESEAGDAGCNKRTKLDAITGSGTK
jgi:hypothetical protein